MKSLRIYLSSHSRESANELASMLTLAGHTVVSTWHLGSDPRPLPADRSRWAENAKRNLATIREGTDALVVIASQEHVERMKMVTGGKFVEAGHALGRCRVYTVGGVENGMLWENGIRHAKDVAELLGMLGEWEPLPAGEAAR